MPICCFVPGCRTGYRSYDKSLFKVPRDEVLLNLWRMKIPRKNRDLQKSDFVCELHFEDHLIENDYVIIINGEEVRMPRGKKKLKDDAIPTIFPDQTEESRTKRFTKKKRAKECFAPKCNIGYKKCKEKATVFGAPNQEALENWKKIIPRADRIFDETCGLCEKHFLPQFIDRHFRYIINGKEVLFPRTRPKLTEDAIPTIFPNLPGYLDNYLQERKLWNNRNAALDTRSKCSKSKRATDKKTFSKKHCKRNSNQMDIGNQSNSTSDVEISSENSKQMTFEEQSISNSGDDENFTQNSNQMAMEQQPNSNTDDEDSNQLTSGEHNSDNKNFILDAKQMEIVKKQSNFVINENIKLDTRVMETEMLDENIPNVNQIKLRKHLMSINKHSKKIALNVKQKTNEKEQISSNENLNACEALILNNTTTKCETSADDVQIFCNSIILPEHWVKISYSALSHVVTFAKWIYYNDHCDQPDQKVVIEKFNPNVFKCTVIIRGVSQESVSLNSANELSEIINHLDVNKICSGIEIQRKTDLENVKSNVILGCDNNFRSTSCLGLVYGSRTICSKCEQQ